MSMFLNTVILNAIKTTTNSRINRMIMITSNDPTLGLEMMNA